MFYRWNHLSEITTTAVVALLGIALSAQAWAIEGSRPPTPCPCGVDGECQANTLLWGHYRTRWRAWPGEESQSSAATPDVIDPGQDEMILDPFERPAPEKEDLRGPEKTNSSKKKDDDEGNTEDTGEEVVQPPLEEAFPDFELQGYRQVMPMSTDDMPPALPSSLNQASPRPLGRLAHERLVVARAHPIAQANAHKSSRLQLVNPAARIVAMETELQEAVYYETENAARDFIGK